MEESKNPEEVEAPLVIIGWREWVSLPNLAIPYIKAKIDTGARSSSLHAFDIERFRESGRSMVRFSVHPIQRRETLVVPCQAEVHDVRSVRSSSGQASDRIVIQTPVLWMGEQWIVDLTLADRTEMGFRMLVGREAMRGRMLVDPGRSYFGGRPRKKKRRRD
ncbi:MAG: ATP-dependent zinc protease [Rubripirellula sp.]